VYTTFIDIEYCDKYKIDMMFICYKLGHNFDKYKIDMMFICYKLGHNFCHDI